MTRILSALVLLPFVVGAIWVFAPLQLLALVEVVLLLAFREFVALAQGLGVQVPKVVAGAAAMAMSIAMGVPGVPVDVALMAAVVALAAVALGAGRRSAAGFHDLTGAIFAALYLGLPLGALVGIRSLVGREAVLVLIGTVMISDTAQFYAGRLFGRRLLAPALSPKKTVEGAAGGFVAGTMAMALLGRWGLPTISTAWLIPLGGVVVALGILGDLFESWLKRGAGLKDTSGLIPGHGGMLDRIDALLFATPAYYVFVRSAT